MPINYLKMGGGEEGGLKPPAPGSLINVILTINVINDHP